MMSHPVHIYKNEIYDFLVTMATDWDWKNKFNFCVCGSDDKTSKLKQKQTDSSLSDHFNKSRWTGSSPSLLQFQEVKLDLYDEKRDNVGPVPTCLCLSFCLFMFVGFLSNKNCQINRKDAADSAPFPWKLEHQPRPHSRFIESSGIEFW